MQHSTLDELSQHYLQLVGYLIRACEAIAFAIAAEAESAPGLTKLCHLRLGPDDDAKRETAARYFEGFVIQAVTAQESQITELPYRIGGRPVFCVVWLLSREGRVFCAFAFAVVGDTLEEVRRRCDEIIRRDPSNHVDVYEDARNPAKDGGTEMLSVAFDQCQ